MSSSSTPSPTPPDELEHPRKILLKLLHRGITSDHLKESDPANALIRKFLDDVKQLVEEKWSEEKEKETVERETQRLREISREVEQLMGHEKFAAYESDAHLVRDNVRKVALDARRRFDELAKTKTVKELSDRVYREAKRGAGLKNIVALAEEAKVKGKKALVSINEEAGKEENGELKGWIQKIMSGKISLNSLLADGAVKLAKTIGWANDPQKSKTIEEDNLLKNLFKFKDSAAPPKSAAEVLVKTSPALPILAEKSDALAREEELAKRYIDWGLKTALEVLTESRLRSIVDSVAEIDPKTEGTIANMISNKDKDGLERQIKRGVLHLLPRLLPKYEFPAIDGVKDGIFYTVKKIVISNLTLHEERIRYVWNPSLRSVMKGDPVVKVVLDDISCDMNGFSWEVRQDYFPYIKRDGIADASVRGVCVVLGFQMVRSEKKTINLALGVSRVSIESVKIDLKGAKIYSLLAEVFASSIRTYLSSLIADSIAETIREHLESFNVRVDENWDAVTAAVLVNVDLLPSEFQALTRAAELEAPVTSRKDAYNVTFATEGTIGLTLGKQQEFVVVRGFKRKGEDMLPAEACGKIKTGDVLIGFNGQEITSLPLDRVMAKLGKAKRPLTLTFVPEGVLTAPAGMLGSTGGSASSPVAGAGPSSSSSSTTTPKRVNVMSVEFTEEKLFLVMKQRAEGLKDAGAVVTGFRSPDEKNANAQGPAQQRGVPLGFVLKAVNERDVLGLSFKETMGLFVSTTARPIRMTFVREPEYLAEFPETAPLDLRFSVLDASEISSSSPTVNAATGNVCIVKGFERTVGNAQTKLGDKLLAGDFVSSVGGTDVSRGAKFEDVISLMKTAPRPVEIAFSRKTEGGNKVTLVGSATFGAGPLGLAFYKSSADGTCCFKAFEGVMGPGERLKVIRPGHALVAVNGVEIASAITEEQAYEMIRSAKLPIKLHFRDLEAKMEGWDAKV